MRYLILLLILLILAPFNARAQQSPQLGGGGTVFGRQPSQWNQFFQSKVDTANGRLTSPTIVNPTIQGGSITGSSVTVANGLPNFAPTHNFTGTVNSEQVLTALGSSSAPNLTQDPSLIVQKWAGSTAVSGVNQAAYFSIYKTANGSNTRATAVFGECQDNVGWSGSGNISFCEGIRTHALLKGSPSPATLGSAYGGVFAALEEVGATHSFLVGVEGEVQNNSVDATTSSGFNSFSAAFNATSDGVKKIEAGYIINPNTAAGSAFIDGFVVPAGNSVPPVTNSGFRMDASAPWGYDGSRGTYSGGLIRGPGYSVNGYGQLTINTPGITRSAPTYQGDLVLVGNKDNLTSLNENGGIEFQNASNVNYGSRIIAPDLGSQNTPLVFQVRNNNVAWTEAFRIDSLNQKINFAFPLPDAILPEFLVSTSTLTKTSDTTLATVPGLSMVLTAGKTYNCQGHLTGTSASGGGIKVSIVSDGTLTASSTTWTGLLWAGSSVNNNATATALPAAVAAGTVIVYSDVWIVGSITVGVGGTLNVQAAQNASNGAATTVLLGSTFQCVRTN